MSKRHKKVSLKLKSRILSESFLPGCIISDLAKSYGISAKTLYNWRRSRKKMKVKSGEPAAEADATPVLASFSAVATSASCVNKGIKVTEFCPESKKSAAFVELPIRDSEVYALQKASLIFEGFALTVEGRVKSSQLFAIVKILEGEARC